MKTIELNEQENNWLKYHLELIISENEKSLVPYSGTSLKIIEQIINKLNEE